MPLSNFHQKHKNRRITQLSPKKIHDSQNHELQQNDYFKAPSFGAGLLYHDKQQEYIKDMLSIDTNNIVG